MRNFLCPIFQIKNIIHYLNYARYKINVLNRIIQNYRVSIFHLKRWKEICTPFLYIYIHLIYIPTSIFSNYIKDLYELKKTRTLKTICHHL